MSTTAQLVAGAELFHALGTPTRLAVVDVLMQSPGASVTTIAVALGVSQPLVSQHLNTLHNARIVRRERIGREVHYFLADEHISHFIDDVLTHVAEPLTPGEDHD